MAKRKTKAEKEAEKAAIEAEQTALEAEKVAAEAEQDAPADAVECDDNPVGNIEQPAAQPEPSPKQSAALKPRTYRKPNGTLVRHN